MGGKGSGGHNKKPTAIKLVEGRGGRDRGMRKLEPEKEAKVDSDIPEKVDWLNEEAEKEWDRITDHLEKAGLLSQIDRAALIGYCQSWGRWAQAEKSLQGEALVGKTKDGQIKTNPRLKIIWQEMQNVWKYLNAFGMTPAARSGLHVNPKQDEQDLWAKFAEMTRARKEATSGKKKK
jgi:P27 family predicted phage terminase small subunit